MASLLESLRALAQSDCLPMHMPGHKRRPLDDALPYAIDITEIRGFDDLHEMRGILKQTADLAARLYGADAAFPLVNGSTCGILAGIRAAVPDGAAVLLPRACHRSVYHALELCRLEPVYLPCGELSVPTPEQVEAALAARPDIRLVLLTSPTYEGVVCDVQAIADAAHARNIPLLVDSAHGAHLGFCAAFPKSAVSCGADLTIVSLHKTLPALTQTALALVSGPRIDPASLARELTVFETSSPSYPLLASIDLCLRLLDAEAAPLFSAYAARLQALYRTLGGLQNIRLYGRCGDPFFDPGKLVLRSGSGPALAAALRTKAHIEPELTAPHHILLMTSLFDDDAAFARVSDALAALDGALPPPPPVDAAPFPLPEQALPIWQARGRAAKRLPLSQSEGQIGAGFVWAYPPGIPLLTPGERVTTQVLQLFERHRTAGVALHDTFSALPEELAVLAESS